MTEEALRLTEDATPEGVRRLSAALAEALDKIDLPMKARFRVELIVEEIVTNLVKYADARSGGPVEVVLERGAGDLTLLIFDTATTPFHPLDAAPPARGHEAPGITPGGLGLELVRKSAQTLHYGPMPDGRNCLRARVRMG